MKRLILLLLTSIVFSKTAHSQDFLKENKYSGDPLYDFIHTWWKTPYRYGGETKKGIDCSAFAGKLFRNVYHVELPRTASEQYVYSKRIKKSELKDGDLLFFRTHVKSGWHVGVYLTDGWFIHSTSKKGVTISNLSEYNRIYYAAGRVLK